MAGNRKDGIKVKDVDALHKLQIRIQPKRCDADCYINQKIDVTNLVKYVENYNKKNKDQKITYFHAFVTAIAKVIYNRPLLNRFIINKTFYDRKDVSVSFVAKISFNDTASEVLTVLKVLEDDNIFKIRDKITKRLDNIRNKKENYGDTDKVMQILAKLPRFMISIVAHVVLFLDRHDILPKAISSDSLYHSSVLMSNLGSIGGNAVYHHLTDFGTNSIIMTMGKIHKEQVVMEDGKVEIRDICDFGITLDERIADGYYFIKSVKLFEKIMNNPKLLEDMANEKITED